MALRLKLARPHNASLIIFNTVCVFSKLSFGSSGHLMPARHAHSFAEQKKVADECEYTKSNGRYLQRQLSINHGHMMLLRSKPMKYSTSIFFQVKKTLNIWT